MRSVSARRGDARHNAASVLPHGDGGSAVRVVPLHRCLLLLLVALLPWLLVVVGRAVCLTAQRVPPVVRLVRRLRRWRGDRPARSGAIPAARSPVDGSAVPPQVRPRPPERREHAHRHADVPLRAEHAEHR